MQYSVDIRSMYDYDDIMGIHCDSLQRIGQRTTKLTDIPKDPKASNENLKGNDHKASKNMYHQGKN